jgi:hypothetical protein
LSKDGKSCKFAKIGETMAEIVTQIFSETLVENFYMEYSIQALDKYGT